MSEIIAYNNAFLSRAQKIIGESIIHEYHNLCGTPFEIIFENDSCNIDVPEELLYDINVIIWLIYGFTPFNS